jgi:hypothetical protein
LISLTCPFGFSHIWPILKLLLQHIVQTVFQLLMYCACPPTLPCPYLISMCCPSFNTQRQDTANPQTMHSTGSNPVHVYDTSDPHILRFDATGMQMWAKARRPTWMYAVLLSSSSTSTELLPSLYFFLGVLAQPELLRCVQDLKLVSR